MATLNRRIHRLEGELGSGDDGTRPIVFISSNAWPDEDRSALEGEPLAFRAPDVATVQRCGLEARDVIERRTGMMVDGSPRRVAVIDVPAPDEVLALDDAAREAWLDEHESRPWKYAERGA